MNKIAEEVCNSKWKAFIGREISRQFFQSFEQVFFKREKQNSGFVQVLAIRFLKVSEDHSSFCFWKRFNFLKPWFLIYFN